MGTPGAFLSNYPPGETGQPRSYVTEARCPNEECERHGDRVEVGMYEELGGHFFDHEEQACCPACGAEMEFGGTQ